MEENQSLIGEIEFAKLSQNHWGQLKLELRGWLLHRESEPNLIEIGLNETPLVLGTPEERTDIAVRFPKIGHAVRSGFRVGIPIEEKLLLPETAYLRASLPSGRTSAMRIAIEEIQE